MMEKSKHSFEFSSFAAFAIQENGKIVVGASGGLNPLDYRVLRYDPSGKLGTTFDSDGKLVLDFDNGLDDEIRDVAIQPDGKILAVGSARNSLGEKDFAVARFLGDAPDIVVTGSDAGSSPLVHVYNATTGEELGTIVPYASTFTGGVRVATGDVNGDGVLDIITVPGFASGTTGSMESRVKVYDGQTRVQLPGAIGSFLAYPATTASPGVPAAPAFTGGLFVATGDVNGDGRADIITGPNSGLARVRVFNGLNAVRLREIVPSFGPGLYQGGARVAAGDVTGDGKADIIIAPGKGAASNIKVYDGATGRQLLRQLGTVLAFERTFIAGVYVAVGDINGDGRADIIVGAGDGSSRMKVFSGRDRRVLGSFTAFDTTLFNRGVRVSVADVNGDGRDDIITGAGSNATGVGQGPLVSLFDGRTLEEIDSFFVNDLDTTHGIFVAGSPRRRS